MSVNKNNAKKRGLVVKVGAGSLFRLILLADVLNFDFCQLDDKDHGWFLTESTDSIPDTVLSVILGKYPELNFLEWAKDLQQELRNDLVPLIAQSPSQAFDGQKQLRQICDKANQMDVKPQWRVRPGDSYFTYEGLGELKGGDNTAKIRNPAIERLGPGQRILKIQGTKWVVDLSFEDAGDQRKTLYGNIMASLQDGSFSLLRECRECGRFFVAKDVRQKFCSSGCTDLFYRKDAVSRVKKSRKRKKEAELRSLKKKEQEIEILRFDQFLRKAASARGRNPDIENIIRRIPDKWRTVNEWLRKLKQGVSLKNIWSQIPVHVKKTLTESWSKGVRHW